MPHGLKRFQHSAQSHFVTFTCYHRRRGFDSPAVYDLFIQVLEEMRCRFTLCVYGYVVMPEHVHLLVREPQIPRLAPKSGANLGHQTEFHSSTNWGNVPSVPRVFFPGSSPSLIRTRLDVTLLRDRER